LNFVIHAEVGSNPKHLEEETRILKTCRFALLLNYLKLIVSNKCEHKTFKNVFSVLFLSWVNSSLYSWQSLASLHGLRRLQPQHTYKLFYITLTIEHYKVCAFSLLLLIKLYDSNLILYLFLQYLINKKSFTRISKYFNINSLECALLTWRHYVRLKPVWLCKPAEKCLVHPVACLVSNCG